VDNFVDKDNKPRQTPCIWRRHYRMTIFSPNLNFDKNQIVMLIANKNQRVASFL
jgi:hypothetical protein